MEYRLCNQECSYKQDIGANRIDQRQVHSSSDCPISATHDPYRAGGKSWLEQQHGAIEAVLHGPGGIDEIVGGGGRVSDGDAAPLPLDEIGRTIKPVMIAWLTQQTDARCVVGSAGDLQLHARAAGVCAGRFGPVARPSGCASCNIVGEVAGW